MLSLLRALGLDAEAWPCPARRDPFETLRELAAQAGRPAGILIFTREKKDDLRAHLSRGQTLVVARLDLTFAPCRTCALTMVRLKHGTEVTMSCGCDGSGTEKSMNGFIGCLRGEKRVFWIGEQSSGGE